MDMPVNDYMLLHHILLNNYMLFSQVLPIPGFLARFYSTSFIYGSILYVTGGGRGTDTYYQLGMPVSAAHRIRFRGNEEM